MSKSKQQGQRGQRGIPVEMLNLVQGQLGEVSRELKAQARRLQSLTGELEELRTNVASLVDTDQADQANGS